VTSDEDEDENQADNSAMQLVEEVYMLCYSTNTNLYKRRRDIDRERETDRKTDR
jgi:hypothetical protein